MGKDDFLTGFLQGLYQGGVGNPEVGRRREEDALSRAYMQSQLDQSAAERGMVPAPQQKDKRSVVSSIMNIMFPGGGGPSLNTSFVQDPNAKRGYLGPEGDFSSEEKEGYVGLSPKETRDFLMKKGSQPLYVTQTYDADGNPTGSKTLDRGQRSAGIVRPQAKKINKPGSSVDATLELYETARQGLLDGLKGTRTGYFSGKLPAITSNQQVAEGAVAAMAPVLKQLFRVSGEGVFTDRDQALLLAMIPTRGTDPAAIPTQIANIDKIVKAKLGLSQSSMETELPTIDSQEAYDQLQSGALYIDGSGTKRRKK